MAAAILGDDTEQLDMLAVVTEGQPAAGIETRQPGGELRITGSRLVTPRMLRLSAVVDVAHLTVDASCPNLVLRLIPPADIDTTGTSGARPPSRTYTIRRYDDTSGRLDFDVVLHGDGPFVRWATAASAGDTISFTGPRPHAVPTFDADALVMVSDESGLPAVASLLEAAPPGLPVHAFVEVVDDAEEQPLTSASSLSVTWLYRGGAAAGTTGGLEPAVRTLDWPAGRVEVWVAGETTEVRAVRRFAATERGVARGDIHAYGYWRLGRSGSPS